MDGYWCLFNKSYRLPRRLVVTQRDFILLVIYFVLLLKSEFGHVLDVGLTGLGNCVKLDEKTV